MVTYYIVIASLIGLICINESSNRNLTQRPQKIIVFLMISILALVAGLRYNVGTDYYNYYSSYDYFKSASLAINDEPGIKIIARISSLIYDDPATMMFLAAVITVILMTTTVIRNSDMYWLSILLYVFLCCWHGCFNGVRQYLAAAVLFAGHCFIKERKFLKYIIIVFMAAMFHITAIVGILFYFYPQIKISFRNILISIVVAFIGTRLYDQIFGFIGFLKSDTFDLSGATYLTNNISPFRIAVAWVPVLFFVILKKYYDTNDDKFKFYMNMSILHAILMTVAMNSAYLGRVGIYTGIYNTITWPLLLQKIEPRTQRLVILVMLILYFLYWRTEATGATLINFQWIFQR